MKEYAAVSANPILIPILGKDGQIIRYDPQVELIFLMNEPEYFYEINDGKREIGKSQNLHQTRMVISTNAMYLLAESLQQIASNIEMKVEDSGVDTTTTEVKTAQDSQE